jgi:hypothetical protein
MYHIQDVFDEVTEEMLKPSWDFDVRKLVTSQTNLFPVIRHIDELEISIRKVNIYFCTFINSVIMMACFR